MDPAPCTCLAGIVKHAGDCEWEAGNEAFYALAAERDRLAALLAVVGAWLSGGDIAGYEVVLADIEATLAQGPRCL